MPIAAFDSRNKTSSVFDMDRFKLERNEKARIVLLDEAPYYAWTHFMKVGGPENRGGYYICPGSEDALRAEKYDPNRCPVCRASGPESERDAAIASARRQFVIHIARYRTSNTGLVIKPVSLALQVWRFGQDKFNRLFDLHGMHGDLRKKDITVSCKGGQYQNYEIDVFPQEPIFATDATVKAQWKELMAQRNPEIERMLGSRLDHGRLEALLGNAAPLLGESDFGVTAAESTLDDIVAEATAGEEFLAPPKEAGEVNLDELLR